MTKRTLISLIQTLLAAVGTLDAGWISYHDATRTALPCDSGGGCDIVNSSHWAFINVLGHPVPVAYFGTLAYIVLLFASVLRLTTDSEALARRVNITMVFATLAGTCYSWYLQYVAKYMIGEYCPYCRVSAITMTLLFVVSLIGVFVSRASSARPLAAVDRPSESPLPS